MVRRPGGGAARQHALVPDRDGSLCRRTSPEPQAAIAWPRHATDAGEIRASLSKTATGERIAEAVQRPTMKFVATKTVEQLDLQALHRVRAQADRPAHRYRQPDSCCWTAGLRCGRDRASCAPKLPRILATRCDVLSPRMVYVIEELAGEWHRLNERIKSVSSEIEAIGRSGPSMRPVDDRAWHRSDHIERDGGRNRQWRGSHEAWLIYVKKLRARAAKEPKLAE
jgi:hypothetical protein